MNAQISYVSSVSLYYSLLAEVSIPLHIRTYIQILMQNIIILYLRSFTTQWSYAFWSSYFSFARKEFKIVLYYVTLKRRKTELLVKRKCKNIQSQHKSLSTSYNYTYLTSSSTYMPILAELCQWDFKYEESIITLKF